MFPNINLSDFIHSDEMFERKRVRNSYGHRSFLHKHGVHFVWTTIFLISLQLVP